MNKQLELIYTIEQKYIYVDGYIRLRGSCNQELKLMVNSNSNSWIGYLKKLELINFELELKFHTKTFYPQINLIVNF